MTLNSMTGFARLEGEIDSHSWTWELKSVNNKNLDIRVKVPAFLDGFDIKAKKLVSGVIARGTVFANLHISGEGSATSLSVNEDKLNAILAALEHVTVSDAIEPARLDGLLSIKGVVEEKEPNLSAENRILLETALSDSLLACANMLVRDRAGEGTRIASVLAAQLADIKTLAASARVIGAGRTDFMHQRFRQQLERLSTIKKPVDEERLAQEVAILAVKADIMEELDRLDSHIVEAENLLESDEPVGRRLDFLCQEFNREANTLCAKAGDTNLTKTGLEIKVLIDQFREQVQNIE